MAKEAINSGYITTPSGRQFAFPDVVRKASGRVSHFTQIKNYPVQSFATADIVPIALLHIEKLLDSMHSCVVNTVHDSIVVDVHPDEVDDVISIIKTGFINVKDSLLTRYNCELNVPLDFEIKKGNNWLDLSTVI